MRVLNIYPRCLKHIKKDVLIILLTYLSILKVRELLVSRFSGFLIPMLLNLFCNFHIVDCTSLLNSFLPFYPPVRKVLTS